MITKIYSYEKDGQTYDVYKLQNAQGAYAEILTYGGRLHSLCVPDKNGELLDVIVGCKRYEDYFEENPYFGATIGRYGNRIGGGGFTLNGTYYPIETNEKGNTLHGGIAGAFNAKRWIAEVRGETLVLSHTSPDGESGFPGKLDVWVFFTMTDDNALVIEYAAVSDKDTVCNLTNHSYFNVGRQDTVLSHELMIKSRQMTPVDDELITHGEFMDIDGTPYSFYSGKLLGEDMFSDAKFIKQCNGYDFNYCLEREGDGLEHFAYVYDKESGIKMDCYTTLPGVQLYTACSTGGFKGKKNYVNHCALCLETQCYPNSPNCPQYPTTTLKAGEKYHETTVYKFSVVK